jgi:hypothetical protein
MHCEPSVISREHIPARARQLDPRKKRILNVQDPMGGKVKNPIAGRCITECAL